MSGRDPSYMYELVRYVYVANFAGSLVAMFFISFDFFLIFAATIDAMPRIRQSLPIRRDIISGTQPAFINDGAQ